MVLEVQKKFPRKCFFYRQFDTRECLSKSNKRKPYFALRSLGTQTSGCKENKTHSNAGMNAKKNSSNIEER